jgi:RNA polymerase sigma-70 factor (ECF subfamily)
LTTPPTPSTEASELVDHLFRHRAGQMVSHLARVFGLENLDLAEDVVQDALTQALRTWPLQGIPLNPSAWLFRVARNRAIDQLRRHRTWSNKEDFLKRTLLPFDRPVADDDATFAGELRDDQLRMIFACCHPAIPRDGQIALTLKTVGGFAVTEIARAFLISDATAAQRIVRAKRRLREEQVALEIPAPEELSDRLEVVLEVLYLLFNEGYSSAEGEDLVRHDLCIEATRLAELLCDHSRTGLPECHALCALFLFQASRLATRTDPEGDLLLLSDQDRSRWDRRLIERAARHLRAAATGDRLTSYHLEAEIASCHSLAKSLEATDWTRILQCYDTLLSLNPSPVIALNRCIALSKVAGPEQALESLASFASEPTLDSYYPAWATRGTLLARVGHRAEALACFERALELNTSAPVRRFLQQRLEELKAEVSSKASPTAGSRA